MTYLCPIDSDTRHYCEIYPVTRDWVEGVGTGTTNSAGVNGATWNEWQFGSAWTTPGGDRGGQSPDLHRVVMPGR